MELVPVEVAVDDIVGGAARDPHEEGAEDEDDEQVPARESVLRDPQRRERRPKPDQRAGRPGAVVQSGMRSQA